MNTYKLVLIDNGDKVTYLIKEYIKKFFPAISVVEVKYTLRKNLLYCVKKHNPNIIILDTAVGAKGAVTLLEELNEINFHVILIHSLKKYDKQAYGFIDSYSLETPLLVEDFIILMNKVIKNEETKRNKLLQDLYTASTLKYIGIPMITKIKVLPIEKLIYCEASGKGTIFHLEGNKTVRSNKNLRTYERILIENPFFRIHQKYLVHLNKVLKINKVGGYTCEVINGTTLPISNKKSEIFRKFLKVKN